MRSAPPLVVSPPVAYLECSNGPPLPLQRRRRQEQAQEQEPGGANAGASSGDFLMAISGDGDVFVWNLGTMTLAAKSSLSPLFRSVTSSGIPPRSSTASSTSASAAASGGGGGGGGGGSGSAGAPTSPHGGLAGNRGSGSGGGGGGGAGVGDVSGKSVSGVTVSRAGVTAEGMPLVMLACSGAFGGSLQAFALHRGLGTWVRVADGRWVRCRGICRGFCRGAREDTGESRFLSPLSHETFVRQDIF